MIIFFDDNGTIYGYQTFPAVYRGDEPHLVVPDDTDLAGKVVIDGVLTTASVESEQAAP